MTEPRCKVIVGAGRLTIDDRTDCRTIEIEFEDCYFTRTGWHSDYETIRAFDYIVRPEFEGSIEDYLAWRHTQWRNLGYCPDSNFYVARQSEWLEHAPVNSQLKAQHYVVDGRDGYVELIATKFRWREWLGAHESTAHVRNWGECVASGEGVE